MTANGTMAAEEKLEVAVSWATFVMPHFVAAHGIPWFNKAIDSILKQTDGDCKCVIIDDVSPAPARRNLERIQELHKSQVHVIFNDERLGAGLSRNVGVRWALEQGSPFVLYLDADDIAHPRRVEVARQVFNMRLEASVVYSSFICVDEDDKLIPQSNLTPMLVEHLLSWDDPPQGPNAWIRIGTETGYTNLTSATSMRTELAYSTPFCESLSGEDAHCWLRCSGAGREFVFTANTPTLYRVPQNQNGGSASRARLGRVQFYMLNAATILAAFTEAMATSIKQGKFSATRAEQNALLARFHVRTGETMACEEVFEAAEESLRTSLKVDRAAALAALGSRKLEKADWVLRVLEQEGINASGSASVSGKRKQRADGAQNGVSSHKVQKGKFDLGQNIYNSHTLADFTKCSDCLARDGEEEGH